MIPLKLARRCQAISPCLLLWREKRDCRFDNRGATAYFKRLSKESCQVFRGRQLRLFGQILENFGIRADTARVSLFTNLSLTVMVVRRTIPNTLPLLIPEVVDETVDFQINAIVDALEILKEQNPQPQ